MLASRGPQREIGHAWQAFEPDTRHRLQTVRHRIEQCAENVRSRDLELPPQHVLRALLRFGDRGKRQQDGAVGEIGPRYHLLDSIENDWLDGSKQHLVLIGVSCRIAKARPLASGREIRQPRQQAGEIVKGQEVTVVGSDEQFVIFPWQGLHRGDAGIDQCPQHFRQHGLRRALLARYRQERIRTDWSHAP